jgi:prepilin-type N-terminal cleavage/methylation domain-containing protein
VARARAEAGFTLVEMVVTMALFLVLVGAPLAWMLVTIHQQNATVSRSWSTTQAEVGLDRLIRDLRETTPGSTTTFTWGASSASVTMTIPQSGTQGASTQAVSWSCTFGSAGTCQRTVGAGTAVSEISNVESVVFAPKDSSGNSLSSGSTTQAAYVAVTLQVQDTSALDPTPNDPTKPSIVRSGAANIVLTGGVNLRNNTL